MRKFKLSSSYGVVLLLAAILAVIFFSYYPVLNNGFLLWDDDVHLTENISVQTLDMEHIKDIFKSTVNHIYIPLTSLSFSIEHHFFGLNPFVYHLDNLLLHLGVVAMVYWFGMNLGLSVLGSGFVALLFGLHPSHVESVAWVTERKDVLYAFFYMAALLSYCRYLAFTKSTPSFQIKKRYRFLVLTVIFGVLSMLAKPMALSLPLILLLMDWFYGRRIDTAALFEKLPLAAAVAGMTWISYVSHARVPGEGIVQGVLIWSWTLAFYLRQFILPVFSVPVYHLSQPVTFSNPEFALSLWVLGVLVFALIRLRRYRWFIFSILFFFFSIFFLLRYDDVGDTNIVADRFMYLPSLGLCFLVGRGWEWLIEKKWLRVLGVVGLMLLTLIFSFKTHTQTKVWRDSISLWQHQLRVFPEDSIALNNLAIALQKQNRYKTAMEEFKKIQTMQAKAPNLDLSQWAHKAMNDVEELIGLYKRAIKAEPFSVDSHYNLGKLYADVGMVNEAIKSYKTALKIDPSYKDAYFNLGDLYRQAGYVSEAIFAYDQAVELNPEEDVLFNAVSAYNEALRADSKNVMYLEARQRMMDGLRQLIHGRSPTATSFFNLGVLYGEMGDDVRAVSAYQTALEINPNHSKSLYNLGNIYRDQGLLAKALEVYQKVAVLDPKNSDAFVNIGSVYVRLGDEKKAKGAFEKAVQADSQNPRAYFNLAYIEEIAGNLRNSIDFYQKSIQFDPENAETHYNLGNVLARLGRNAEALSAYKKAVEINSDYVDALVNLSLLSFKEKDYKGAVQYCDEAIIRGYVPPESYKKALEIYRNKN